MFAGDFNINLQRYNSSSVSNFLATIYSRSLYPTVTIPTQISKYSATVIDNILINNSHKLSGIIYADISDHLPIFAILPISKNKRNNAKQEVFKTQINFKNFIHDLINIIGWPNFMKFFQVDNAYDYFLNILQVKTTLHKHKIDYNIKPKIIKQQWMINGLLKFCCTKNKLYKKYLGSLVAKQEYIKYKNILTKLLKKRKTEYFNEFINQHKKDSRKV